MINENDILSSETEKTPIIIDTNNMTRMNLQERSINSNIARVDKKVVVIDSKALQNTSYIMMGYNKEGLVLGDGSFVSVDDINAALIAAYNNQPAGTFIVDRVEHQISMVELQSVVRTVAIRNAGAIKVGGPNPNITNQDSRNWSVVNEGRNPVNKGTAFLGNRGITLDSGLYISLEEVTEALRNYMFANKIFRIRPPKRDLNIDPIPFDTPRETREAAIVSKVTKRTKTSVLPLILAGAIMLSGFGYQNHPATRDLDHLVETTEVVTDYQESVDRAKQNIVMGQELPVYDEQVFHSRAASEGGTFKQMGQEFTYENKLEGDYRVTGFAITVDGRLVPGGYIQDFYGQDNETKLQDFLEEQLTKNNLSIEDIEIMIHMGNSTDNTRLGWININELINESTLTDDMLVKETVTRAYDFGTTQNFSGDYITLSNGSQIRVTDNNGNLLPAGALVMGSDNIEYTIKNLEFTNIQEAHRDLVYNIGGPQIAIALGGAALFIANYLRNKNKNKQNLDEAKFFKFRKEEEYSKFKDDFIAAKEKYDKQSRFKKVLKNLIFGKETEILQNLTDEQIQELYSIIQKHNGKDFSIGSMDSIVFNNGKVNIRRQNGQLENIMGHIIDEIKGIGVKNKVEAEGRYEDGHRGR